LYRYHLEIGKRDRYKNAKEKRLNGKMREFQPLILWVLQNRMT